MYRLIKRYSVCFFSLLLGAGWGIFAYSYWLVDLFSAFNRRAVDAAIAVTVIQVIIHVIAFPKLIFPFWVTHSNKQRLLLVIWSVVIGIWVFFVSTGAWYRNKEYIIPFLPVHSIELAVQSGEQAGSNPLSLKYFFTSLGDVSFSQLGKKGWERKDKFTLTLVSSEENFLRWRGRVGERVELHFVANLPVTLSVRWDHKERVIQIDQKQFRYVQKFDVPWYAGKTALWVLGSVLFGVLAMMIITLAWKFHLRWYIQVGQWITAERFSRQDVVLMLLMWMLAFGLRGFYLESLSPYVDEYAHLLAAKKLLLGAPLNSVYQRSLWITTIPVLISFRLFGVAIWSARLAGVFVNSLAVFPLYWLTRRINRPIAAIAAFLYATNPWLIATARNVREYAYYPLYFYGTVCVMIWFLEHFFAHKWKMGKLRIFGGALVLIIPVIYGLFLDPQSTFKALLLAYGVFAIFLLWKVFEFIRSPYWRVVCVFLAIAPGVIVFWLNFKDLFTLISPGFLYRLRLFLTPSNQQWYSSRILIFVSLAFLSSVRLAFVFRHRIWISSYIVGLFVVFFLPLVFWFSRYSRPRYLTMVEIWYVLFLAIGVYVLWSYIKIILPRRWAILVSVLMLVSTFNPIESLRPAFWKPLGLEIYLQREQTYITEESHFNVFAAHEFLMKHVSPADALVASVYGRYAEFVDEPKFNAMLNYKDQPLSFVVQFVRRYSSGWIVLDRYRIPEGLSKNSLTFDNVFINYIGEFGDLIIWKWNKK